MRTAPEPRNVRRWARVLRPGVVARVDLCAADGLIVAWAMLGELAKPDADPLDPVNVREWELATRSGADGVAVLLDLARELLIEIRASGPQSAPVAYSEWVDLCDLVLKVAQEQQQGKP